MAPAKISTLHVRRTLGRSNGRLRAGGVSIPCRLGAGGVTWRKREGDGCTPAGDFLLLFHYFRDDRGWRAPIGIPGRPVRAADGWCDDPASDRYNRPCPAGSPIRHERMMREDRLYDVVFVLDHNQRPRVRGLGSAIFFHLTSVDGRPTAGCVAIAPQDMRRLLPRLASTVRMVIR
jgi:L,D-peptidoglycan transpeptidase YkuD (ErfK/YbiS/YcfS/YnhG family)